MSEAPGRGIAIALSLVVAVVVGIGLYVAGSPATARQEALDERRVEDLQDVKAEVHDYWREHRRLPAAIDSVSPVPEDAGAYRDPVTAAPYEYRAISDSIYELCAVFTHRSPARSRFPWRHPSGRHCFRMLATERY